MANFRRYRPFPVSKVAPRISRRLAHRKDSWDLQSMGSPRSSPNPRMIGFNRLKPPCLSALPKHSDKRRRFDQFGASSLRFETTQTGSLIKKLHFPAFLTRDRSQNVVQRLIATFMEKSLGKDEGLRRSPVLSLLGRSINASQ